MRLHIGPRVLDRVLVRAVRIQATGAPTFTRGSRLTRRVLKHDLLSLEVAAQMCGLAAEV